MVDVLFVCTGNLCRSPSAALLLGQHLAQAGIRDVSVHSAGTLCAEVDPPEALVQEGRAFGLDLGVHVPLQVDQDGIEAADLVVGMTREHVREIVLPDFARFARTFTLCEIVRRGQGVGPRKTGEALSDWLERLGEGRRTVDLVGDSPDDDIADPMGGLPADYHRMFTEVSALTWSLHRLAWPRE